MSSLMNMLQGAGGGQGLAQLGQQFGLDRAQVENLTSMLAPALGQATAAQARAGNDETVLRQIEGSGLAGLLDRPEAAADEGVRAQGESFLSSILDGGARGTLEARAAEQSSVSPDTVASFLPALAAMVQGAMQQQVPDDEIAAERSRSGGLGDLLGGLGGQQQGGALGGLMNMLDQDNDGSPIDDVLGMFGRR